ncbi:FtsX-like permease family protein [Fulvivirga sp. M361]|uniref:ABC transporter permease n=1 Tax=Fulvivirga sp. M361 TaxID=2594266 RepID=UPI00117B32C0|nr:ABC transporter permease [Fulvivirga sp. M361]TRX51404.1 FtsX-like permease family protein [Fulvivirga sp. M361]
MLRNYLKTTFRSLLKNKIFSFINLFGLAIGMASVLMITIYVKYERSYEKFYDNAYDIFRVTLDLYNGSEFVVNDCETYQTLGPEFSEKMPEVRDYVRFMHYGTGEVFAPSTLNRHYEHKIYLADPSAFTIFDYSMLFGDPSVNFDAPFKVVLTETIAQKYFGELDVIGEVIELAGLETPFEIVAVMKDLPQNTHLKFDMLVSHATIPKVFTSYEKYPWGGNNEYTYLLMNKGVSVEEFNEKLKQYSLDNENITDEIVISERITDIHLYSNKTFEPEVNGSAQTVNFMVLIGMFIIALAWVNYINLSTAKSLERAREVGVRKVVGSSKTQLISQFLFDAFIINLLAAVFAFTIVQLGMPVFRDITGQDLPSTMVTDLQLWGLLLAIMLLGTFLAGSYPALVLSSFKPAVVLKGKFTRSFKGLLLRKGLVVFQFLTTVVLLSVSLAVYFQIDHLSTADLGVKIDNTVVLRSPPRIKYDSAFAGLVNTYKNELSQQSWVSGVSVAEAVPGVELHEINTTTGIRRVEADEKEGTFNYYTYGVQPDYFNVLGIQLVAGKFFPDKAKAQIVINERAVETLGYENAESALGKKITYFRYDEPCEIVGVIRNFYQRSPKEKHIPMVMYCSGQSDYHLFVVKLNTSDTKKALATMSDLWKNVFVNSSFDYYFLNDQYNHQYQTDQRFGNVTVLFTVLSIIIASLGLFGLSSFTIAQRTKEIGIRKALGATVSGIVHLLSKDFLKLIMIAGLLAIPAAYYLVLLWLDNYASKIELEWWLFVMPLALILVIAIITIIGQTIKTAIQNPVGSLRHE